MIAPILSSYKNTSLFTKYEHCLLRDSVLHVLRADRSRHVSGAAQKGIFPNVIMDSIHSKWFHPYHCPDPLDCRHDIIVDTGA